MNQFAKKRNDAGYSQMAVSKILRVDRSAVSKWETGVAKPLPGKLVKLAKLYGCTIEDLLTDAEADDQEAV